MQHARCGVAARMQESKPVPDGFRRVQCLRRATDATRRILTVLKTRPGVTSSTVTASGPLERLKSSSCATAVSAEVETEGDSIA
jgi:hypothetical protein